MRLALCVVAVLLMAACVGGDPAAKKDSDVKRAGGTRAAAAIALSPGETPPGCDATRPAVLHGFDGEPVDADSVLGIPCLVTSPFGSYEPSIGLTSKGNLYLYPGEKEPLPQLAQARQFTGLGMVRSVDQGSGGIE